MQDNLKKLKEGDVNPYKQRYRDLINHRMLSRLFTDSDFKIKRDFIPLNYFNMYNELTDAISSVLDKYLPNE